MNITKIKQAEISDQRKGIKWYRKLAIEYVLGIPVVNAYIIYKINNIVSIEIRQFRENLITEMFSFRNIMQLYRLRPTSLIYVAFY